MPQSILKTKYLTLPCFVLGLYILTTLSISLGLLLPVYSLPYSCNPVFGLFTSASFYLFYHEENNKLKKIKLNVLLVKPYEAANHLKYLLTTLSY